MGKDVRLSASRFCMAISPSRSRPTTRMSPAPRSARDRRPWSPTHGGSQDDKTKRIELGEGPASSSGERSASHRSKPPGTGGDPASHQGGRRLKPTWSDLNMALSIPEQFTGPLRRKFRGSQPGIQQADQGRPRVRVHALAELAGENEPDVSPVRTRARMRPRYRDQPGNAGDFHRFGRRAGIGIASSCCVSCSLSSSPAGPASRTVQRNLRIHRGKAIGR